MPFQPQHNVARGIHRLLMAPQTVPVRDPVPWRDPPITVDRASPRHQALYAEYKEVLAEAMLIAEGWWDDMVEAATDRGLSPDDAAQEVLSMVFAGPAARGEVVWTVRTFWLRCHALNRESSESERVPPQVLLLRWLVDEKQDRWVDILTGMPYWPIGLSEDNDWV
jgi:hypothetical protein